MGSVNLVQACVDRTAAVMNEDLAIFTSSWRETLAFQPDNVDMTSSARAAANAKLTTFWNAIAPYINNKHKLINFRWYDIPDAAPHKPVFVQEFPITPIPGGSSGAAPFQNSCTVTFRTDSRKHWGRFYIPGFNISGLDTTTLQLAAATVDAICTAAKPLTDRSNTTLDHPTLTVWSRTQGTHHDPQYVEVDSVPDVIRRRRSSVTLYKKILPAG